MPHQRSRHCLDLLKKKLKFSPIVTIQGARQVGKSFLARDILPKDAPQSKYLTLDNKTLRERALKTPDSFLESHLDFNPLIIDEAQKAPDLFDAIKAQVDSNRRPGRYLLLGSTEFSKEVLIKESLTGRISRIRLFSFNLAEALNLAPNESQIAFGLNPTPRIKRKEFINHLSHGGFPHIFHVRDESIQNELLKDWLNITTQRDLLLFPKHKSDPELAFDILEKIATLECPDAPEIARVLGKDLRRIKTHLVLLESLFVIHKIPAAPFGTGQEIYFLCDVGLSTYLGATLERQIHTLLISERLSQISYKLGDFAKLSYYRSQKSSMVHLLEENKTNINAIQIFTDERILPRDLRRLHGFQKKALGFFGKEKKIQIMGIGPVLNTHIIDDVFIYPWDAIA